MLYDIYYDLNQKEGISALFLSLREGDNNNERYVYSHPILPSNLLLLRFQ